MNCPRCNTRLVGGANFCHHCGQCVAEAGLDEFTPPDLAAELAGDVQGEVELKGQDFRPGHPATSQASSGEPEQDIWEGGFSIRAMAASFVVTGLVTVTSLIGSVIAYLRDQIGICGVLLLLIPLVWLAQSLRVIKRCLSRRYRLTDRRLFLQIGLVHCQKHQIDLAQVETVRIHQSMLDQLLDVGSIELLTRDRHIGRLLLEGIDDADSVAEKIRSLSRRGGDKQVATVERVGSVR